MWTKALKRWWVTQTTLLLLPCNSQREMKYCRDSRTQLQWLSQERIISVTICQAVQKYWFSFMHIKSPWPCSILKRIRVFKGLNKQFISSWFLSGKETAIEALLFSYRLRITSLIHLLLSLLLSFVWMQHQNSQIKICKSVHDKRKC